MGLRTSTADVPFALMSIGRAITVTVSVGAAIVNDAGESATDLLRRADEALYQAKRQGRNRVIADFAMPERAPPRTAYY